MATNKEYEHGYRMGYEWVRFENGHSSGVFRELRNRGISMHTAYAVGFRKGVDDAEKGIAQRYGR